LEARFKDHFKLKMNVLSCFLASNDVLVSFSQKHENGPVMIYFTYHVL